MEIRLAFYFFDEYYRVKPLIPNTPEGADWQPMAGLISQIAKKQGLELDSQHELSDKDPHILVLFAKTNHLSMPEALDNLAAKDTDAHAVKNERLRYVITSRDKKEPESWLRRMRPVITIGAEDFTALFAEKDPFADSMQQRQHLYKIHFDHRVKFWDSSIWHRYVPVDALFVQRFESVLKSTIDNYRNGLYASYVSIATLETQTRIMLNAYICEVGDHGHGEVVTPFKFHSETRMGEAADQILEELQRIGYSDQKLFETVRWNLLLVDDYAKAALHSYWENVKGCEKLVISKKNLIANILHHRHENYADRAGVEETPDERDLFSISDLGDTKENIIRQGLKKLSEKVYDLILLDYLLGSGADWRIGREYGYDFLHRLNNVAYSFDGENKPLREGPIGPFLDFSYFFFPFAFEDKLKQLGMDGESVHWHLSKGGDPVSTPELFRYNFLNFIKQQIAEYYLYPQALFDLFKRYAHIENGKLWRELMINALDHIALRRSVLENDEDQGSLFARTMLSYIRNDEHYKNILNSLKSFILNIKMIPYTRLDTAFKEIAEHLKTEDIKPEAFIELLKEKSGLFFKAERLFEQRVEDHKQGGKRFQFDGQQLRWLPDAVAVLQEKGVKDLLLSNNNLSQLPEKISEMTALEKLDVSHNNLQSLPKNLRQLKSLEYLDLSENPALPEYLRTKHEGRKAIQSLFDKSQTWRINRTKKVVVSYAHEDAEDLKALEKILKPMQRDGLIEYWTDHHILPGDEWDASIHAHFQEADIILLLVTIDFLASDYIHNVEMRIAMERREQNECEIIPLILKHAAWKEHFLQKFQVLPSSGHPVYSTYWQHTDEAWEDVSKGIRKAVLKQ